MTFLAHFYTQIVNPERSAYPKEIDLGSLIAYIVTNTLPIVQCKLNEKLQKTELEAAILHYWLDSNFQMNIFLLGQ